MNKPIPAQFYLALITFLLTALCSCDTADRPLKTAGLMAGSGISVDRLIKKGEASQGAGTDSLVPVCRELKRAWAATGNKTALVYADVFSAQYNWMKASHAVAMQFALRALANAEKWHIDKALPGIYVIMANLDKESGNFGLAFKAINKGIAAARQNRDTAELIRMLGTKAMFTHSYYFFYNKPQDDKTSLALQMSGLKMAESDQKYESRRIQFYNNIAQTYKERKDYGKALFYGGKAVVLAKKYNRQHSLTYSYCWLGETYYYMGQRQKGLGYLNLAVNIAWRINEPYRQMEIRRAMYDCYLSAASYQNALTSYRAYRHLKDSLELARNAKQLNEFQFKYDAVKKDKQIAVLSQINKLNRRNVVIITISAFLFLVLFMLILFQYFIIRKNHLLAEGKNTGLNNAMVKIAFIQSHEVRKPLATLLGIINLIKEDDYEADKEVLKMIEASALNLDRKIHEIVEEVEAS